MPYLPITPIKWPAWRSLPKYKLNDAQQKEQFDILTQKLDAEMQDFLSPENYAIHKESFTIIVEKVYTQKNWE